MNYKLLITWLLLLAGPTIHAQDILGFWNGRADLMGQLLRVEFDLTKTEDGIRGVFRSPDQNDGSMEISDARFENDSLFIEIESLQLRFQGAYSKESDTVVGSLQQMGAIYPIALQREPLAKIELRRPQTPIKPYPFDEIELEVVNRKKHTLSGSLVLPEGDIRAAVIMISGSGPQDRNSEILGHQLFLVWANEFAKHGIASYRYDERGVGASEGKFNAVTSFDLANDVLDIYSELQKQESLKSLPIGLVGHSEGGLIVALCAAENKEIDFVVSLAGLGQSGREVLVSQNADIALAEGMSNEAALEQRNNIDALCEIVVNTKDSLAINQKIEEHFRRIAAGDPQLEETIEANIRSLNTPWMRTFLQTDARDYWSKVDCPVLAINGDKDTQVAAGSNLRAIEFALRRNKNTTYKTVTLPNHNHLFQETDNGAPSLYGRIEQSVSPLTMETVIEWIKTQW